MRSGRRRDRIGSKRRTILYTIRHKNVCTICLTKSKIHFLDYITARLAVVVTLWVPAAVGKTIHVTKEVKTSFVRKLCEYFQTEETKESRWQYCFVQDGKRFTLHPMRGKRAVLTGTFQSPKCFFFISSCSFQLSDETWWREWCLWSMGATGVFNDGLNKSSFFVTNIIYLMVNRFRNKWFYVQLGAFNFLNKNISCASACP